MAQTYMLVGPTITNFEVGFGGTLGHGFKRKRNLSLSLSLSLNHTMLITI
jgi:hypothetical protein